jgi:hypothetical protein
MAEQTFRSPGFFEQEIDLSAREKAPVGTPAGIIGTAVKGPAFVPITVGSFADFEARFGGIDPDRYGPYAVKEYLKYKDAVMYMRVLGAGSNDTSSEIGNTTNFGVVSKAGFKIEATADSNHHGLSKGCVQFIVAKHYISASYEAVGFPEFTDNSSFPDLGAGDGTVNLVRGVLFTTTGSRAVITDWDTPVSASLVNAKFNGSQATRCEAGSSEAFKTFKFILSSSTGKPFAFDDDLTGVRIFSASLDPTLPSYISKVLNTDPQKFEEKEHLLYLDFAVEDELAPVSNTVHAIGLLSGSSNSNPIGLGDSWLNSFGRFDSRYSAPSTPIATSQPFGETEYNLFHFEALSDGAWANDKIKVSIANLRASTDPNDLYGTFTVEVRRFSDTDLAKEVIESYPECNLDPTSDRYVAAQVGDKKVKFDFDSEDPDERRLVISGKYPNKSVWIRVVMNQKVEDADVPTTSLPFGFLGIPVLKTTDTMTDVATGLSWNGTVYGHTTTSNARMSLSLSSSTVDAGAGTITAVSGAIVPPIPMRFKCTRGQVQNLFTDGASPDYAGDVGKNERVDSRLYWGVKFERCPLTGSTNNAAMNTNVSSLANPMIAALTKFQGFVKADNLVSGSGADHFNNNHFTLARVALYNKLQSTHITHITGSANEHMIQAAYIRNGAWNGSNYTVSDGTRTGRITMATLIHSSSVKFNRFQDYNKFTMPFYGGFDGLNIMNKDISLMRDRAASKDPNGYGGDEITGGLGLVGTNNGVMMGKGKQNNCIFSYRTAVEMMTDPMTVNSNLLAVPGIRDPFITDLASDRTKAYSMAMYVMDMRAYDEDANRLFTSDPAKRDVRETAEQFEGLRIDNNYVATYFPDVYINDPVNNRNVLVPSSVVTLGALAFNDTVAYPWFAPAGFNRGSLGEVTNTQVRLTSADRDTLYDARINPIANFPNGGFVIFGQKTLQMAKSSLDRVNVRRLLLEVKRLVVQVADKLLFEPNNAATRARFTGQVAPILALIQSQAGIEKFSVICDDTNNTQEDVDGNKMNGRIVVVPTRAIEFIAIDFIVTNSGVLFL